MPLGVNSIELQDFYHGGPSLPVASNTLVGSAINQFTSMVSPFGKSIQKAYRYTFTIFPNLFSKNATSGIPLIRSWHVKSIKIPQYSFSKDQQMYGPVPRSFPIMDHKGFEVSINFEEDDKGTIGYLINYLSRLPINSQTGNYRAPNQVKIPLMGVVTENDIGSPIGVYTFHDSFYLNADGPDLDYSSGNAVGYTITFHTDVINSFFPQAAAVESIRNAIAPSIFNP